MYYIRGKPASIHSSMHTTYFVCMRASCTHAWGGLAGEATHLGPLDGGLGSVHDVVFYGFIFYPVEMLS